MKSSWPTRKLGDKNYFEILGSGIDKFEGKKDYLSTSSIEGNKVIKIEEKITYYNRPSRANMRPRLNSVWFARMMNTVKVYSFTEENKEEINKYVLSTGFAGILCNPEKVLPKYIEKIFLSKWFNSLKDVLASNKAIQKSLNNDDIEDLKIPLPPLSIQQKIVSILDTIQEAIEVQEKIIEKTKELKKSLLNEIFNSKFKNQNSKIKFKIQKWVKLGDENYFEIKLGGTPKTNRNEYWNGEINWITPNDLNKLTSQYIVETERKITLEGLRNGSNLLPSGSLILSTRAPIGYLAILDKDMAFNQGCKGILFKNSKEIFNLYIYYYLLTQVNKLKELGSGSTFRELSTSDLKKFNVPLMSISEQKEIAGILQMIDEKIEIEKKKKELYEELFKTMLNKLMNQEIDVENLQI